MPDTIIVTILDDGTVKAEVQGSISAPNHAIAEKALDAIAKDLGGETKIERKGRHSHSHSHTHSHQTENAG